MREYPFTDCCIRHIEIQFLNFFSPFIFHAHVCLVATCNLLQKLFLRDTFIELFVYVRSCSTCGHVLLVFSHLFNSDFFLVFSCFLEFFISIYIYLRAFYVRSRAMCPSSCVDPPLCLCLCIYLCKASWFICDYYNFNAFDLVLPRNAP